jgi:hypothetical protein
MKSTVITLALLSTVALASAQERLPRDQALKYACLVSMDLKQLTETPIPTDVDIKRPVALHDGDFGGMILPEAKLTAQQIAGAKSDIVPIGQLWLLNLTPMRDGEAILAERLRLATVSDKGNDVQVPQCALGVKRNDAGGLELLVFGKSKEPLVKAPLKVLENKASQPGIEIEAERESSSGRVTLTIVGKYQASIEVTQLQL